MRSRLVVLSVTLAVLACGAISSARTHVAVLGPAHNESIQKFISLAEAQLGDAGDLQIVERQQIDKILAEQKLSLTDLVRGDNAIKVGKLATTDLLAILESDDPLHPAIVIFDAITGVRLWDASLSPAAGTNMADGIVDAVRRATLKRQHADTLRTVCVLSVRNADLPREMNPFCDAVGRLLERNLVASPDLALLERTRLDQVTRERAITADAVGNRLLASLITIDIDVSRSGTGLRATAILSDGTGKTTGKFSAESADSNAATLATQVAAGLLRRADLPHGLGQFDRTAEAARFAAESEFRTSHTDFMRAVAPAEAAHALDPESLSYHLMVAETLIHQAVLIDRGWPPGESIVREPLPPEEDAPPLAARSAEVLADVADRLVSDDPATRTTIEKQGRETVSQLCNFILWADCRRNLSSGHSTAPSPESLLPIRAGLRHFLLMQDARLRATVRDRASFEAYTAHLLDLLPDIEWVTSKDAGEWVADLNALATRWFEMRAPFADDASPAGKDLLRLLSGGWAIERHRYVTIMGAKGPPLRWNLTPADLDRLSRVGNLFHGIPEETMRVDAGIFNLTVSVVAVQDAPDVMKDRVGEYLKTAKQRLAGPELAGDKPKRQLIYDGMVRADTLLDRTKWCGFYSQGLIDFMLQRNEIFLPLLSRPHGGEIQAPLTPQKVNEDIARYESIVAALRKPDVVVLGVDDPTRVIQSYERLINIRRHPESVQYARVKATSRPWTQSHKLIDLFDAGDGVQWVLAPIAHEQRVYALGQRRDGKGPWALQFMTVPLDGSPLQFGHTLPIDYRAGKLEPLHRSSYHNQAVSGACLANGFYCAAVGREGIFLFPLDGSPPTVLDDHNGLPARAARAVAVLDGKLYAGLDLPMKEGYLVSYDFGSHAVDVLASSIRRDKRSPLDNGPPFEIRGIVSDPPRHRLLVMTYRPEQENRLSGLWEYKPDGDRWRRLVPMQVTPPQLQDMKFIFSADPIEYVGPLTGDVFPITTMEGILLYDVAKDCPYRLYERTRPNFDPPFALDMPRWPSETDAGERALVNRHTFNFFCLPMGDWLWDAGTLKPWGRTNLKTGAREQFPPLRENGNDFVNYCLQPLSDGNLLAGDQFGLWVLTLPADGK